MSAPPSPSGGAPTPPSPTGFAPIANRGSSIVGTLTADGRTGGFDLNVFRTAAHSTALCDSDTSCSVRRLPDGSSLAVGSWHDGEVAGGLTYQVELARPDGGEILLVLSTEHNPKGQSTVASRLPLNVEQMIAFVRSERW